MIKILIASAILYPVFEPKIDYDEDNGKVFLWFNWYGKREYLKLYDKNNFN